MKESVLETIHYTEEVKILYRSNKSFKSPVLANCITVIASSCQLYNGNRQFLPTA